MDPEIDDMALFGVKDKKEEDKPSQPIDAEKLNKLLAEGTPGELEAYFQEYGMTEPSIRKEYMQKQEKTKADAALSARAFEFAKADFDIVEKLLKNKNYQYLGGASAKLAGSYGMDVFTPGFGDAQGDIMKLKSSLFVQNVNIMKNLGSLSNQEGKNLSDAVSALFTILPNENGDYPAVKSEEWIEEQLLMLKQIYSDAKDRLARGVRVDPETGKELTQAEYTAKNPDLNTPPDATVEADANAAAGTPDPTVQDLRNLKLSNKEINIRMLEFSKTAKPGQKIIRPDGKTFTKQ
jgi:hypothetical protein